MAKKVKGLLTRRDEFSFIPSYEEDKTLLSKIKIGEQVAYNVSDTRSIGYHRRYFKLMTVSIDMMPEQYSKVFDKPIKLIRAIQDVLEMYEEYTDYNGINQKIYDTISFSGMGQKRFKQLYSDSGDVILSTFLKHITFEDFNKHLQGLM